MSSFAGYVRPLSPLRPAESVRGGVLDETPSTGSLQGFGGTKRTWGGYLRRKFLLSGLSLHLRRSGPGFCVPQPLPFDNHISATFTVVRVCLRI